MDTILILDDDAATLHGIAEVLRPEHYSILEASTGLQAIETGRQCGQLSLLVALVLYAHYPHLPILFMSGNAIADWRSQDRINLKQFTTDLVGFLEKPFSAPELKMRVRELIGRRTQIQIGKKNQGNRAA